MNITFELKDMPGSVKGFTRKNPDWSRTIVLNSRLSSEMQKTAYMHELSHIDGNDFDIDLQADLIEQMRHGKGGR